MLPPNISQYYCYRDQYQCVHIAQTARTLIMLPPNTIYYNITATEINTSVFISPKLQER